MPPGAGEVGRGSKGGLGMIATETAKTVILILFGLAILWVVVIVIKNDTETIIRALAVAAVLGLSLFYVNQTKLEKLSFSAVKDDLFPPKTRNYAFEIREGFLAGRPMTTYIFEDPGPPLPLALEDGGKHMVIRDIKPINRILEFLGLPPVTSGVSELASITHQALDTDKYRWDDYEKGVLLLERGICHDMTSAQSSPCIARITIYGR
jgi:hypothetical protein